MKSKTLAVFGIGTYILSVISSAQDREGNYTAPIALIVVSALATLIFIIMAVVRLWKTQKLSTVLFIASCLTPLVYTSPLVRIVSFILFMWVIVRLWAKGKFESRATQIQGESGLSSEELSSVENDLKAGNHDAAVQKISAAQERLKRIYKETTGLDAAQIVAEIGRDISWADIINHTFRVIEFDRCNTTIDRNLRVKARSTFLPYGYLLAVSPILNNRIRIPIIHRDDFLLAASVFDEPKLAAMVEDEELLVTYAPKHLLPKGLSGSPHHVLHYTIVPHGTVDSYYSKNNDMYMANPDPQLLFGQFVYEGEIKVNINPEPTF